MAIVLLIIGLGWAAIGGGNVLSMFAKMGGPNPQVGQGLATFGLIFNMALFILPGLIVAGIGEMLRRRRKRPVPVMVTDVRRSACPNCGEMIPVAARTCRFCGRSLMVERV